MSTPSITARKTSPVDEMLRLEVSARQFSALADQHRIEDPALAGLFDDISEDILSCWAAIGRKSLAARQPAPMADIGFRMSLTFSVIDRAPVKN